MTPAFQVVNHVVTETLPPTFGYEAWDVGLWLIAAMLVVASGALLVVPVPKVQVEDDDDPFTFP